MPDIMDLFPKFIHPEPNTGCWLCASNNNQRGYGRLYVGPNDNLVTAHILSYELSVGPVPRGMQLDHLCRITCCVNPSHLEPVTPYENMRRANRDRERERGFRCPNGHPRSGSNIYVRPNGSRQCKACAEASRLRYRERVAGGQQ